MTKGKQVWLITGAGRGLGVDIAKAALDAGHSVVATGRDDAKVAAAIGIHDNLLTARLDVTNPEDAQAAVQSALSKFDHATSCVERGRLEFVKIDARGNHSPAIIPPIPEHLSRPGLDLLIHKQPHLPSGKIQDSESHVARLCQCKRNRDAASSEGVGLALQKPRTEGGSRDGIRPGRNRAEELSTP